jgi:predicted Holliday junction resolvase-like endonuclease
MAAVSEHFAPMTPGFPYHHKDVQWIGGKGVVDAIVWDGLEAGGEVGIVFLDIKDGPYARLTPDQRRIRDALKAKRVSFEVYKMPAALTMDDVTSHAPELLSPGDPGDGAGLSWHTLPQ